MTLDPQSVYILTAAAARLAYGIGLHRNFKDLRFSQKEIDQRRNVFWIVYFLDKSVALRLGHPSTILDDDIGVDLPAGNNLIEKQPDGSKRYHIFRHQVQLAMIESRVYTELYSVRAQNKPPLDRLRSVGELDKVLLEWQAALPVEIQPEKTIQCVSEQFIPIVLMHFAFFNCLTTVHRISIHHGPWTSTNSSQDGSKPPYQQLNPRVYASQSICLMAARRSIQLLEYVHLRDDSIRNHLIWFVSAVYSKFPLENH
jgi:hypothetical protein